MLATLLALTLAATPSAPALSAPAEAPPRYPPSRQGDAVDDYFGTRIADPYRWLEDDNSDETKAWVKAQNAVSGAWLAAVRERPALRERLRELWDFERYTPPVQRGGRYFYTRNSGLQNQAVLYVTDDPARDGRILLDPNSLSKDGTIALSGKAVTDDGRLLAYALSEAGSDWETWHVREVATGRDLPDQVRWAKFGGASWRKDASGFYYTRFPEPKPGEALTGSNQGHQLWFHRLGTPQAQDQLVFARPDQPEWYLDGDVTDDGRWLVVTARKGTNPETSVFLLDLSRPDARPEPFLDRMDASYQVVDDEGDLFYVLTDQGAPRKRLVAIRRGRAEPSAWREIIPEGPGRDVLEAVSLVGERFVAHWMRDARSAVEVRDLKGGKLAEVALPSLGTVSGLEGRRRDGETFYGFTGFTAPPAVYRLDLRSLSSSVFRRPQVRLDPGALESRQVFYKSKDGTSIPMFLVHRKGLALDGRNPTLLYGYGGFKISITPFFSVPNAVWLEMGGVLAVPNLRGGGEYGQAWYDAGRLGRKQNVFDDFIAAAEWLVANRYTSPPRLAIAGGSNGGLLVGACLTQRPELFGAAVPAVGVLDMLRFHRFTVGWGWKSDYGSSETKEGFEVLVKYSPLHNLRPGARYPATLVLTADHDDRVVPAHSFKFTAALQAAQGGPAPILARIETRAGHGAGKPTDKQIEERADVLAFLARALGIELPPAWAARGREGAAPSGGAAGGAAAR